MENLYEIKHVADPRISTRCVEEIMTLIFMLGLFFC